jgi:hypothetical protein
MKIRLYSALIALALLIMFVSCFKNPLEGHTTITTSLEHTASQTTSFYENPIENPNNYKDIEIKLPSNKDIILEEDNDYPFRIGYYRLQGTIADMISEEERNKFWEDRNQKFPYGVEVDSCCVKDFVKYFNIQKNDFEMRIRKLLFAEQYLNNDIRREENELPNPDIIYTFDDDIINEYYRRE